MSSNITKVVASVTALAMISAMVACGPVNKKDNSNINTGICINYSFDKKYEVKKGDTLYEIAKKYYDDGAYWKELAMYNGIKDPKALGVSLTLYIPTLKTLLKVCDGIDVKDKDVKIYRIKKGDTLSEICDKFYGDNSRSTVDKLATYNNLENPNEIEANGLIQIPTEKRLEKVKEKDYSDCYKSSARTLNLPKNL